jgi:predicted nucleic acid-binding protein
LKLRFVFDATPLIHLGRSGQSGLIAQLGGDKFTVPAVVREVVSESGGTMTAYPDAAVTASLIDQGVIRVRSPSAKGTKVISRLHRDIHVGEAEVLALAKEIGGIAVIDDRVARAVARIHGVRVEGTYGVVLRAARRGNISTREAEDALDALVLSGWRCDTELYAALLKALRGVGAARGR